MMLHGSLRDFRVGSKRRAILVGLLLAILCLNETVAMAADPQHGVQPPTRFRLEDVSIQAVRHSGNAAFGPERATLTGKGPATLERGGQVQQFRCPAGELLGLLDEFYRLRFFSLPEEYLARHSLIQKDDGTVIARVLHLSDAPSTSICLAVGGVKKCVAFGDQGPSDLEALTRRIFDTAERLSGQKAAKAGK